MTGLSTVAERQADGTIGPSGKARQLGQTLQCGRMGRWNGEKQLGHSDGWGATTLSAATRRSGDERAGMARTPSGCNTWGVQGDLTGQQGNGEWQGGGATCNSRTAGSKQRDELGTEQR